MWTQEKEHALAINSLETSVIGWQGQKSEHHNDWVVQERPLDIRVTPGEEDALEQRLAVTLRTPGDDIALALGYLFSEGVVSSADDCVIEQSKEDQVHITLKPWVNYSQRQLARGSYIHSGCGLCGKTFIDALHNMRQSANDLVPVAFEPSWLATLDRSLKNTQSLFAKTGGSHAAGLLDLQGDLVAVAEDIGRHNALDKVIGKTLLNAQNPRGKILWISGRSGFELVQKAVMAEAGMLVSVGAPSSLGVAIAEEFNLTLVAFARGGKANVYHQGVS